MFSKKHFIFILIITFLFSQNVWTGISVSTSDNLDALSLNPAGFGISRGEQVGYYIPVENDNFSFFEARRYSNFGYSLYYKEKDPWDHLSGVNIGFGTKMGKTHYLGLLWSKTKTLPVSSHLITIGSIIRPFNFLSLGLTTTIDGNNDFDDTEIQSYRGGLAIRPFSSHKLTIGADYAVNPDKTTTLHPFASIDVIDGVNLSFSGSIDLETSTTKLNSYQLNLGFNLSKFGAYSTQNNNNDFGVGFYTDTQILSSIFNKKKEDTKKYIRMRLDGLFIEEKPTTSFLDNMFGNEQGIQLRAWLEQIQELTDDPEVDGLIIDFGHVRAGLAKKNEMRRALQNFKDAGKEIILYSEYGVGSMTDYFLMSTADKIFLSELTGLYIAGINIEVSFIRGLLDTLSIVPEVFRVNFDGKSYKTYADPYIDRKMSDEFRENYTDVFQDLYDIMIKGISEGRGLTEEKTREAIDNGPYFILSDAINAGLVDSLMYPDQFDKYVKELNDEKNTIVKWHNIDYSEDYVNNWVPEEKEKIALIYAVGTIMPGNSDPGPTGSSMMGDKTIRKAIKSARENKDIKAIVLRIDSGGGSAHASDNMWREMYRTTTEDTINIKPFIASMSDVAASGGYYIACEADSILADEATITGSIGVIGLRFNISQLIKRFGINIEGIKFGENADFASGSRLIEDEERKRIEESIDEVYTIFKDKVKDGRDNIDDEYNLDEIALGRVFTGQRASNLDMSLVDKLGGLYDAIETAKNAAGIDGEIEIVEYPRKEKEKSPFTFFGSSKIAAKNEILNALPEEIKEYYELIELMSVLSKDEKQMILPYKIEVK